MTAFETGDPQRITQFIDFALSSDYSKAFNIDKAPKVYVYCPWEGLQQAYTEQTDNGAITSYKNAAEKSNNSGFSSMDDAPTIGLRAALTQMDKKLKDPEEHTVFIIKNLEAETVELTQALRSWTTQRAIFNSHSSIFLFVTSAHKLMDDALIHLSTVIKVPFSSEEERTAIADGTAASLRVRNHVYEQPYDPMIIDLSSGMTLHDFTSALLESHIVEGKFSPDEIRKHKISIIEKTGVLRFIEPKFGFEAVGGYQATKDFIENDILAILKNPELAERIGLKPPRGVLFLGPPGTGKTLFGEAITFMLGLPMVELNLSDVLNKYVGESETKLRQVIALIEAISPIVVWMDELDSMGQRDSGESDGGVRRELFGIFLRWMGDKDRKAIILAATNDPENIDEAMLRAGRLDRKIPILLPNEDARLRILEIHTAVKRKMPLSDDVDLSQIAEQTKTYSGAELEDLVLRAGRIAFTEQRDSENGVTVSMKHFTSALASINIDEDKRRKMIERYDRLAEKFCDDKTFLKSLNKTGMMGDRVDFLS